MVILKFNKLIRNKWVWGVFALIVSIAFVAPNGCLYGSDSDRAAAAYNKLPEVDFDSDLYEKCDYLVRGRILDVMGLSPLFDASKADSVWKVYAAVKAFEEAGVVVTDDILSERIKTLQPFMNPSTMAFDPTTYSQRVQDMFRMPVAQFENYVRLALTLESGLAAVGASSGSISPAETELACRDFSDKFTVRIATFTEDKAAAEKIKVDAAAIGKYFNENKGSYEFPDRYKVRYLKLDPQASNLLAKVTVTDEQIKARYEENKESGLYDVASTNDVVNVKPLEEVRDRIVVDLKNEAARAALEEEVLAAMPENTEKDKTARFLDEFAAKKGLKPETSDWFAFGGNDLDGFAKRVQLVFPGVNVGELRNKVRDLVDSDLNIVSTPNALWIFQSAGVSESFVPEFDSASQKFRKPETEDLEDAGADAKKEKALTKAEEAAAVEFDKKMKSLVGPDALAAARADFFKKTVEAVIAKGADAVLKSKNVSAPVTFQPCQFAKAIPIGWVNRYGEWDFSKAGFANASTIVFETRKLMKGGVSDFIRLATGKAAVIVCLDRIPGTAEDYERGIEFARNVEAMQRYASTSDTVSKWLDWNLKRLGYKDTFSEAGEDVQEEKSVE